MPERRGHGKTALRWCDSCGTLLLQDICSACGSKGRKFQVNSPGDIRPAMKGDEQLVRSLFARHFGTDIPLQGKAIFLNKVAGEDRAEEIVVGGEVVATMRWDLFSRDYLIELRGPGASLILPYARKNVLHCDKLGGHIKGRTFPGNIIRSVEGDFGENEPLVLVSGNMICAAVARAPSSMIVKAERGFKVKDVARESFDAGPSSGREDFVKANRERLMFLEMNAISDIRSFVKGKKQAITASFSGGKDSLASFLLAEKALENEPDLLFVNTGIEFPETVEYVHHFAGSRGLILHEFSAGDSFWENVDAFGPPAKDFRWCCKSCKLGPLTEGISKISPQGTITVEGNRALESFSRSETRFVARNPFVPNQTVMNPIRSWNASEVWGYIWIRGADYNPLYEMGYARIGCYLCPASLASDWERTRNIHPEMYRHWNDYLHSWARSRGLPREYVDMGFWRWKSLPPKMIKLTEGLDISLRPQPGELNLRILKGASPCAAGGYSIEAVLSMPSRRELSMMQYSLRTIGDVRYSDEYGIALLRYKGASAKIFAGGQVSVVAPSKELAEELFSLTIKALLRYQMCTECGICAKGCPSKAIGIDGGLIVSESCSHCGKCLRSCMVVHYHDHILSVLGS